MRQVLLVAYHFPPEPASGALRPGYLAKYLYEFGWEVTVLTRPLTDQFARNGPLHGSSWRVFEARVIGESMENAVRRALDAGSERDAERSPSKLRKALRWAQSSLLFPDRTVGWLPAAVFRGISLDRRTRFDAIISTAMPATVHVVGGAIALSRDLPWIADYRDPWAGNPGLNPGATRARLELQLERSLLRRAASITTISGPIADQLERVHGRRPVVIPNASDPVDWRDSVPISPPGFVLCYTGTMFEGLRTPELLFAGLAALRDENDPAAAARVVFYGPASGHVAELARRFGIESIVEQYGVVSREKALAAQREASNLLIFLNMDPSSAFELGSKIIEYARARRPILAFGPPNSAMRGYLDRNALGWFASSLEEAKRAIRSAYRRFTDGDFELSVGPDVVYDARDLAKAFADQLESSLR